MPNARLIEKTEIQRATRRRTGDHLQKEREDARRWLQEARETGRAIELTLGPLERDETIKARYRIIARDEQCKVRFQTAKTRTYRNRKGDEEREAEVMIVTVV